LVDEVLAVGDFAFQKKCIDKINELASEKTSMIIVSHNENHLRALCDRLILLEKGIIADSGPVSQMLDLYHDKLIQVEEIQWKREILSQFDLFCIESSLNQVVL